MALCFACLRKICYNDKCICADDSLFSWCLSCFFLFFYYFFPIRNSSKLKLFAVIFFFFLPLSSQKSAFLPCLVQIHHCFFITFGCSPLESKHRKKIRELKYESHFLPCNAFSFTPTHFFNQSWGLKAGHPVHVFLHFTLKSLQRERCAIIQQK